MVFKKSIVLLLAAVCLLGSCFLLPKEEETLAPPLMKPPEISYKTFQVKRSTIIDKVTSVGYFVYTDQIPLYFRHQSGRLKDIYVYLGQEVKKGTLLADLDTGNLGLDLEAQSIRLENSKLILERKKLLGVDKFEQKLAENDVRLNEITLEKLNREMSYSRLYAPQDGEIVYIARVDAGNYVDSYKTMIQIADPNKLMLSYSGNNLSDYRSGMEVNVRINNEYYSGTVVMTPRDFPIDLPDDQRNQIYIQVKDLPEDISKGSRATIELILQKQEDTLVIPRNQVKYYMGRKFVYVLEDGIRVERNIETGIETSTEVEVLKGLEENELVVLR